MSQNDNRTLEKPAPFQNIVSLLDALWADELEHYRTGERPPGHVFVHLVALANWMNGTDLTPGDYVEARASSEGRGWDVLKAGGGEVARTWTYEGHGSRYRMPGTRPGTAAAVGCDRPLRSFYAQVWDAPPGADEPDDESLLLWVGMSWAEVPTVEGLAEALAGYATVPDDLKAELVFDSIRGWEAGRNRPGRQ